MVSTEKAEVRQVTVGVFFDGVIAMPSSSESKYGDPIPGASTFLDRLSRMGLRVIIYTDRLCGDDFSDDIVIDGIRHWLKQYDMSYDELCFVVPECHVVIDNRAKAVEPKRDPDAYAQVLAELQYEYNTSER